MYSVYTTLEEFENGGRLQSENTSNVFRPRYARRILKRNNHVIVSIVFEKCPSTQKREADVFKIFRFEERFPKAVCF